LKFSFEIRKSTNRIQTNRRCTNCCVSSDWLFEIDR